MKVTSGASVTDMSIFVIRWGWWGSFGLAYQLDMHR